MSKDVNKNAGAATEKAVEAKISQKEDVGTGEQNAKRAAKKAIEPYGNNPYILVSRQIDGDSVTTTDAMNVAMAGCIVRTTATVKGEIVSQSTDFVPNARVKLGEYIDEGKRSAPTFIMG